MNEPHRPRTKYVIGPDGSPLTIADLPTPGTKRWVIRRKAEVVAAVRYSLWRKPAAATRSRSMNSSPGNTRSTGTASRAYALHAPSNIDKNEVSATATRPSRPVGLDARPLANARRTASASASLCPVLDYARGAAVLVRRPSAMPVRTMVRAQTAETLLGGSVRDSWAHAPLGVP